LAIDIPVNSGIASDRRIDWASVQRFAVRPAWRAALAWKVEGRMRTRKIFSATLALAILGAAVAQAQELLTAPLTLQAPVQLSTPVSETARTSSQTTPGMLSSWIAYTRPDCCGPVGGNGPIDYELFLRGGLSLPVEGKNFGHVLDVGWEVEGGARSLFFNPAMDRDWSIDFGISNILNRGQHSDGKFP